VVPGHQLVATPGDPQSTACVFTDANAPHPLGVTVAQHTYAFASAPDQDYVILDYALTTATEQSNVYVGLWLDADVGNGSTNVGAWLPDALGGFIRSGPGPDSTRVAAVALAGAAPCGFRFIHNPTYVSPLGDINDAVAWGFLTSGSFETSTPFAADWSLLLAFGPLQLSPERATHVGLAVAAAGSEATLRATAAAARSRYASVVTAVDAGAPPARFALGLPSPNPFNPRLEVPVDVPAGGLPMRLEVCDARGRRVRTLWSGPHPAGRHVLVWDGRDDRGRPTASGIYLVRLASPTVTLHRKVALVR